MRVTTFNLRCKCREQDEKNIWENRLPNIKIQLDFLDSDLYGFQELRKEQYDDVIPLLPLYDSVFQGRNGDEDEGTPIFYKKDKFELLEKGSYYLNEHPETPGKGWDACCLRVASFVALKEKSSGKIFTYFNTHLDHVGKVAQAEGIKLMVQKMKEVGGSMLLSGDFNVYENDVTYKIATEFLPKVKEVLSKHNVELRLDSFAQNIIEGTPAGENDFDTEFLDYKMAVAVVDDVDAAILHITEHSTHHSDCIITESEEKCTTILRKC